MPRNPAGKWVARAGATGGSRTYRGQTPINWYAALTVIVVLGLLSLVFAVYEYRNPGSGATTTTPPTTKTTWYAGIDFNLCGKIQPNLASNATSTASKKAFYTTGDGVITVSPKTNTDAGKNAVLGKFVSGYQGLTLSATQLGLPPSTTAKHTSSTTSTIYKNGDKCPKGTPDAGQTAEVQVTYWPSATLQSAKAKSVTGDPSTLRFTHNQLITVGFVPVGTKLAKPSSTVILAVLQKSSASSTTTTTTAASGATTTTTAASGATTTTAASGATTTPTTASSTTTTVAPTTTTTSKK